MYTAFTKEIDGLTVILGLDKERLDPIKTNSRIKPLLEESSEFKAKSVRLKNMSKLQIGNDSLLRQGRVIAERVALRIGVPRTELKSTDFLPSEQNSLNGYNSRMLANNEELQSILSELPEIEKNLKKKTAELQKSNGVFFELTNEYENKITDAQYEEFSGKLNQIKNKKMFLLSDGSLVVDNRNKTFYGWNGDFWDKKEIKKLGEVFDDGIYKLHEDLTEEEKIEISEQFENDRIIALTEEEKETEKTMLINNALSQSVKMRNEMEITGDPEALKKAQDFYNSEVVRITSIY